MLGADRSTSSIVPFESSPGAATAGLPGRAPEDRRRVIADTLSDGREGMLVIKLRETIMILDLHQQGLTVSAISRQTGIDRKTVRKYIERGLEAPAYGPRKPRATVIDPFASYLRERIKSYPGLTGSRLFRELRERGYTGGYTAVTDFLRDVRPAANQGFEVRFETPPGEQAQVDFAQFHVVFTDEPRTPRIVWLFSMVLGHRSSDLGALRHASKPADRSALPYRGLRGSRRCSAGSALRQDEDGRHRRRPDRRHRL